MTITKVMTTTLMKRQRVSKESDVGLSSDWSAPLFIVSGTKSQSRSHSLYLYRCSMHMTLSPNCTSNSITSNIITSNIIRSNIINHHLVLCKCIFYGLMVCTSVLFYVNLFSGNTLFWLVGWTVGRLVRRLVCWLEDQSCPTFRVWKAMYYAFFMIYQFHY